MSDEQTPWFIVQGSAFIVPFFLLVLNSESNAYQQFSR